MERTRAPRAFSDPAPLVRLTLTPSNVARVLTNSCLRASLGVAELLIFHPVDTIAKRLMSNKAKVSTFLLFCTNVHDLNL